MNTILRRTALGLAGAALLLPVLAGPVAAHVTANPDAADSPYFRTTLRVGHGCEGSPTTSVRVQLPAGVENPRPEVVTGWETEIVPGEVDPAAPEAETGHGAPAAPVAEVAWVGGNLPDTNFQEFGLSFRIAEDAPEVLWFPTIQECEEGEHRWIEVPATIAEWGDLDEPAPYVINNLAAASADGAGTAADADADGEAPAADGEPVPAAATERDDSSALPAIGLAAGLLGLGAGTAALVVSLRSRRA